MIPVTLQVSPQAYNRGSGDRMIQFHALEAPQLARFLERHKSGRGLRDDVDLDLVLRQILQKAYEFVPAESGSILLDDPFHKLDSRAENDLVFVATFGESSRDLVGHRLSARHGIVGHVYQSGHPYLSTDAQTDSHFYRAIDLQIGHTTHSIVAVPVYIGKTVCGVLELVNRVDEKRFSARDMTLLEIFAGYTSFMLQNALDARSAHELAKKDDLTGLYNDRWFHMRLTEVLAEARLAKTPSVLIFLDLDRFKWINDAHGHLAGSQVLREIGFILKRIVSSTDATVARYGGDEFVIILPKTDVAGGVRMAEQIRDAIGTTTYVQREWGFSMPPLHLAGILTASLGVAPHTPVVADETSIDVQKSELLRRADAAMYRAKSLGKNKVVVWSEEMLSSGGELTDPRTE